MKRHFKPRNVATLAEIDVPDVAYEANCVAIQGVVSPISQCAWDARNAEYKVHCFTLAAWRLLGGPIVRRDLTILRPIPTDVESYFDFPAYSIQRFSVLLSKDRTRAVFEGTLEADSPDVSMLALASELKTPVIVSSNRFGSLKLDRGGGWFEGEAEWNAKKVRLRFRAAEETSLAMAIKVAETLWSDPVTWKRRIDDCAVKNLLKLKNESWLGEGDSAVGATQFAERMRLEAITFSSDGRFEFWHDDGDLFWGHSIEVLGNVVDGPTDASIQG